MGKRGSLVGASRKTFLSCVGDRLRCYLCWQILHLDELKSHLGDEPRDIHDSRCSLVRLIEMRRPAPVGGAIPLGEILDCIKGSQ